MKKLIILALAAAVATACNWGSSTPDVTWTKSIESDIVTTNTETSDSFTDTTIVTIESKDITKPYLNFTIEGVRFVAMMPEVNFVLENVPFKLYASDDVNDPLYNSWTFSEKAIVPTVGGVSREEYTMHNFMGNISDDGVVLEFDVNFGGTIYHAAFGRNNALQTWEAQFECAANVVLNPGEGSTVTTDNLTISFFQANRSKQVVDITFRGIRFVEQMPEISFELENVPFSFSEDGTTRIFNVAGVMPVINGEQNEMYAISTFRGSVSKDSLMLDFDLEQMDVHTSITNL